MLTTDDSNDDVWFISSPLEAKDEGLTLHRRGEGPAGAISRRFEEVQQDWEQMVTRVMELARSTDTAAPAAHMQLSELEVQLGFTASGKLAFIAEAGVAGSITLTFSRNSAEVTSPAASPPAIP